MIQFTCIVQQDQAAHRAADRLEDGLRALSRHHLDDAPTAVAWHITAPGAMFTGGRPSTSSIVSAALVRPTSAIERERLLSAICELWTRESGCSPHEVLVAIADASP